MPLSFREHTSLLDSDAVPLAHLKTLRAKTNPMELALFPVDLDEKTELRPTPSGGGYTSFVRPRAKLQGGTMQQQNPTTRETVDTKTPAANIMLLQQLKEKLGIG